MIDTCEVVKENRLHINVKNYRTHTKADELSDRALACIKEVLGSTICDIIQGYIE